MKKNKKVSPKYNTVFFFNMKNPYEPGVELGLRKPRERRFSTRIPPSHKHLVPFLSFSKLGVRLSLKAPFGLFCRQATAGSEVAVRADREEGAICALQIRLPFFLSPLSYFLFSFNGAFSGEPCSALIYFFLLRNFGSPLFYGGRMFS